MSIHQKAIITRIEGSKLHVSICRPDACSSCKAQSACSTVGGGKEAILEDDGMGRQVGDEITLKIKHSQGTTAVILAYIAPAFMMIGILIGLQRLGVSEMTSGLSTLGGLILYYIILRIFRRKIESELTIEIE